MSEREKAIIDNARKRANTPAEKPPYCVYLGCKENCRLGCPARNKALLMAEDNGRYFLPTIGVSSHRLFINKSTGKVYVKNSDQQIEHDALKNK
jgi:hypothetical protein